MGYLSSGVNSRIRSPGSVQRYRAFQNSRYCCFNFFLYCTLVRLSLPTVKVSAEVLDHQSNALYRLGIFDWGFWIVSHKSQISNPKLN
jgi:hypothetical protein